MPSQHKHKPVAYRPPADVRDWLMNLKAAGHAVNRIITDALREYRAAHDKEEAMSGTWVIEFAAPTIGAAMDMVRQSVPDGVAGPGVTVAGRLGYETASSDYGFIERLAGIARRYGDPIISKR